MLKLTGGEHKGRPLKWLDSTRIRPTPARVREALCNIFAEDIAGSRWWDLYCGSGSVGLEMLSRGAEEVLFVDHNRQSLNYLKQNIKQFGLQQQAKIQSSDIRAFLKRQKSIDAHFIYCDPPYDAHHLYRDSLKMLGQLPWTPASERSGSLNLLIETRQRDQPWEKEPELLDAWKLRDSRRYGDIRIHHLERKV